jgi:hypothetical protein
MLVREHLNEALADMLQCFSHALGRIREGGGMCCPARVLGRCLVLTLAAFAAATAAVIAISGQLVIKAAA